MHNKQMMIISELPNSLNNTAIYITTERVIIIINNYAHLMYVYIIRQMKLYVILRSYSLFVSCPNKRLVKPHAATHH